MKDSEVTIVSCRARQSIKMASSNKKVLKFDNNNMDYYSDNNTTTKTTRKKKEKRSDDDSSTKGAYKKKVAKEDHDQKYPPIATQHSQGRGKVKLKNTPIGYDSNSEEENMDLSIRQMLRDSRYGKNDNDNSDTDCDSSSDSSHNSSGSESSAPVARNEKTLSRSNNNTTFSNHPQETN